MAWLAVRNRSTMNEYECLLTDASTVSGQEASFSRSFGGHRSRQARQSGRHTPFIFLILFITCRYTAFRRKSAPEAIDTWHAFVVRIFRTLYKPDFSPHWVKLQRPRPNGYEEVYQKAFHAPVSFDADYSEICLPLEDMDAPLVGGNREIANQFDQLVENYLTELDETDIVTKARQVIIEQLPSGKCSRQGVATKLGVSSSALQLRLARQETSFQALLDDVRQSLALTYIQQERIPITEIAFLIGFADTSSFSRIFRKWTGLTPSKYREYLR